jgi:hypothetical protein
MLGIALAGTTGGEHEYCNMLPPTLQYCQHLSPFATVVPQLLSALVATVTGQGVGVTVGNAVAPPCNKKTPDGMHLTVTAALPVA